MTWFFTVITSSYWLFVPVKFPLVARWIGICPVVVGVSWLVIVVFVGRAVAVILEMYLSSSIIVCGVTVPYFPR